MQPFRKLLRNGLWAVLGVLVLLSVLIFLTRNSIDWRVVVNGGGDAIPTTAPKETNRVTIASCSIVLPDRWHGKTFVDDETGYADMNAWPDSVLPTRYGAGLRVEVSPECPHGVEDATERQFLGYNAHELLIRHDDGGLEDPPLFSYTLLLEIDAKWYRLTYWNHAVMSDLPNSILDHLMTFRVDSEKPKA